MQDIHEGNIAVNGYCPDLESYVEDARRLVQEHMDSSRLLFSLFDFDKAIKLPPETSLRDCRRPAWEASYGIHDYHPDDILMAERHYNPFSFDVACLGMLFATYFTASVLHALH